MAPLLLQIQNIPSLPLYTSLVALVILVLCWMRFKATHIPTLLKLPPGPRKLPVLGNLLQLVGAVPHHCLRDLASKYGPIIHLRVGQVSVVVISSPELTKELLQTQEAIFSQRHTSDLAVTASSNVLSGVFFSPYNHFWRQMRRISVLELLSRKRVLSYRSIREEEAWNLVQSIKDHYQTKLGHLNLSEVIFSMQNNVTARAALGKKCKHGKEFTALINESLLLAGGFALADLFPSLKFLPYLTGIRSALEKINKKVDQILNDVISEHKDKTISRAHDAADEQEDALVDVLLKLQDAGGLQFDLTTTHIKAVTLEMYAGGSETSATTTEWAMSELMRNPKVMQKAQAEVRQVLARKRKIYEADIVLINVWAMGRDPTHLGAEADSFQPERFQGSGSIDYRGSNLEFIPFGAGKRICPGITFGTAAVELALAQLLYHFDWRLPSGTGTKLEQLDMTESVGWNTKRRDDLYVVAIPFLP
ncbi:desmethyl-deoxy-podophyllotoxin synthase-like [Rosa rugosa]|uniref:desmethyl-deoxy-podophyllotoxin synthase-like n=1 Tax=Rosa rugosa TaxID=74645 RepID=UPI002B40A7C1|nr:desmethyl-deoxy-podophyllotoxin synthase-like [Rosa rugosa]